MGKRLIYVKKGNGGLPDFAWAQRDVLVTDCLDPADVDDGSIVLFEGGEAYPALEIRGKSDVVIGSWGGPAAIDGRDASGIVLEGCRRSLVFGLRVRGSGRERNRQGTGVHLIGCDQTAVRNVEVSGFRHSGIGIRSGNDITIEGCYAHDNGFCGICTDIGDNFNRRVAIRHCKAYDNAGDPDIRSNHSGSGIALFHTEDGLVEYCEAAGNGWAQRQDNHNGPVGVWCACDCKNIVFRKSISRHNCTQPGGVDGDGFDIDGAVVGGLMEYNYSYENEGSGYLLCEYGSGLPWKDNHLRYCVSLGDAWRVARQGAVQFFGPEGLPLADSRVERCLLVPARGRHGVVNNEVGKGCTGLAVRENVIVEGDLSAIREPDTPHMTLQGNRIVQDRAVYESFVKAAPRLTDPRRLDGSPVFELLETDALAEWLAGHAPAELFDLPETEAPAFGGEPFLSYFLDGRDFGGSDYTGECRQVYDHIRPGPALEMKAGAELWLPHPTWYESPAWAVVLTARLRSPDVSAELYVQTEKGRIAVPVAGDAGDYAQTALCFVNAASTPRIGVTVRGGDGGLLAESLRLYAVTAAAAAEWRQRPASSVRTIGDVCRRDGCLYLSGSGSGIIGHYTGYAALEAEIEAGKAGGLLFIRQHGHAHSRREILLAPERRRYDIPLPAKGEFECGVWNGAPLQDVIKVYRFALK